jgi:putative tricarboxylic transport membrane protein
MARKGRAGPALGISALGSFIGGTFSIFGLVFLVFPLAETALKLGPPEYFSIIFMSMIILTYMAAGSFAKALI